MGLISQKVWLTNPPQKLKNCYQKSCGMEQFLHCFLLKRNVRWPHSSSARAMQQGTGRNTGLCCCCVNQSFWCWWGSVRPRRSATAGKHSQSQMPPVLFFRTKFYHFMPKVMPQFSSPYSPPSLDRSSQTSLFLSAPQSALAIFLSA